MIFRLFRKETEQEKTASRLYEAIVAQARQPVFYIDYAVEDTVNGRYEMIMLHAYMLFRRLREEDEATRALGQAVFDRFFRDMDDSLREIGIGDLSVPKKIKKMAQSFYGRVEAYDTAREQGDDALALALVRNVYAESSEDRLPQARMLASYVLLCEETLQKQSASDFVAGRLDFAAIPAASV